MGKKEAAAVAGVVIGAVGAFYVGAACDFLPFLGDDPAARAMGFCTLIVCLVLVVCTLTVLSRLHGKERDKRGGKKLHAIVGTGVGVVLSYYAFGMYNFFLFPGDDFGVRAAGFCALVCGVVAVICTLTILSHLGKRTPPGEEKTEKEE